MEKDVMTPKIEKVVKKLEEAKKEFRVVIMDEMEREANREGLTRMSLGLILSLTKGNKEVDNKRIEELDDMYQDKIGDVFYAEWSWERGWTKSSLA